ncbi:Site-specific recombinase XerD [Archaeoglobus sulfaticallidus PM70-1]|uniref:Site-specific recombinase XerD n=1 Tax=Archaeoglobus sulfaticallidus PM70-1 TaxID=387631 RepID=N0BNB4_9EURY|nr:tyrosine-type recombinase/integrase [Archaeoglobus sulfaticallidus]AGK62126.1 Site-specific recombinase XerD [Archaeoglobus sulfaticallidus PM70-1]
MEALMQTSFLEAFREDCISRGMTSESIRRYISCLRIFLKWLDERNVDVKGVDKFVLRDFLSYLRSKGLKQKTLENYFSAISSFYDFLLYEGVVKGNPVNPVRKRYLNPYKKNKSSEKRVLTVEEASLLVNSIPYIRDKAIVLLLLKTGIRRGELISIDVQDINWEEQSILLKPKAKRSNRVVFFDDETGRILKKWMKVREKLNPKTDALFVNERGERLRRNGVYGAVTKWASMLGFHNPESDNPMDHFTPHTCRHCFTMWLRKSGMRREFIKELRGDSRREAIDIYDHIDKDELRKAYLAHIPKLGVE